MTTTEHLAAIKRHIEIRLAGLRMQRDTGYLCTFEKDAEAGWKSTLAAMDALQLAKMDTKFVSGDGESALSCVDDEVPTDIGRSANYAISIILAAWPIETLK